VGRVPLLTKSEIWSNQIPFQKLWQELRAINLWDKNYKASLGSLGGKMFNVAFAINNRGQVVGQSDLPGDTFTHAFFWQDGVMTDLGTLPGDSNSMATDINNKGQVVGNSCDINFNCRTFLWKNDIMTDLSTRIPPASPLQLTFAGGINDRGEIAGSAFDQATGVSPAFLAVPCDDSHADDKECQWGDQDAFAVERPHVGLPENIREQLRKRLRFGGSRH
jgi:probable HAF family extracellular repeat protein